MLILIDIFSFLNYHEGGWFFVVMALIEQARNIDVENYKLMVKSIEQKVSCQN